MVQKRVATINKEETRTQQQFRDKVNINSIMAKYRKTGLIDHVRKNPGVYSDMTKVVSYQEALNTVISAQATFDTLPANVRARFQNDPHQLIEFLKDSKNDEEAGKLGLIIPKAPPKPPEQIAAETPKEKNSFRKTSGSTLPEVNKRSALAFLDVEQSSKLHSFNDHDAPKTD